jgi:hypothetical protein
MCFVLHDQWNKYNPLLDCAAIYRKPSVLLETITDLFAPNSFILLEVV